MSGKEEILPDFFDASKPAGSHDTRSWAVANKRGAFLNLMIKYNTALMKGR